MILVICFVISGIVFTYGVNCKPQTLLLISLDGFRWDFARKAHTPYLDFLANSGVTVPFVRSVFPTVTYPGHYSIVTVSIQKAMGL